MPLGRRESSIQELANSGIWGLHKTSERSYRFAFAVQGAGEEDAWTRRGHLEERSVGETQTSLWGLEAIVLNAEQPRVHAPPSKRSTGRQHSMSVAAENHRISIVLATRN